MLPKLHDDIFVVLTDVARGVPPVAVAVGMLLLFSFILTWIKHSSDRSGAEWSEEEEGGMLCTFPMCGKELDQEKQEEWVQDKYVSLFYCSKTCMKRNWRENNHQSVIHLLKKRKEQLEKEREALEKKRQGAWLDELSDIIPNPKGFLGVDLQLVCDNVASQVEIDAARMTARTFSSAYMKKFGTAVHTWTYECFKTSGKGCILIHLSEKAVEESGGAPISFVQKRILAPLRDRELNRMIAEYDPESQIVLYIMQRGVDKKNLLFPFCYTVYPKGSEADKKEAATSEPAKPKESAKDKKNK